MIGAGASEITGADQTLVLRNRQGDETVRQLRLMVLEMEGDGNRTIFVFDEPRDVKGTAFLIHSHRDGDDDQWLYLPALGRVKRISSSNRSGSFMGSEFAYEDLGEPLVEHYSHKYLRDEPCGDLECTVSERVPLESDSGYSRLLVWIDKDELRTHRVEFYDRKNELQKTLTSSNFELFLDKYWQARNLVIENHLTGKSSEMIFHEIEFRADLDERNFTKTGLKRIR